MRIQAAVIFLVLSTGAFAQGLSAGLAISGGWFFKGFDTSEQSPSVSSNLTDAFVPFRAGLFLDGRYFSLRVGYKLAIAGHETQTQTISGTTTTLTDQGLGTKGYLSLSVYGKYPFSVGPFLLYPLLGLEQDTLLLYLDANGNDVRGTLSLDQLANENQLWVKAGVGADWPLFAGGYLRAELVLGYKFPSSAENAAVQNATSAGFNATLFTLEPDFTLAIGFRW